MRATICPASTLSPCSTNNSAILPEPLGLRFTRCTGGTGPLDVIRTVRFCASTGTVIVAIASTFGCDRLFAIYMVVGTASNPAATNPTAHRLGCREGFFGDCFWGVLLSAILVSAALVSTV